MSVLIRDMEMPNNCKECDLFIEGACYAKGYRDYRIVMDKSKPDDCPLEEIPAGVRLIDANKMRRSVKFTGGTGELFKEWIDRQPTVIETEADQ